MLSSNRPPCRRWLTPLLACLALSPAAARAADLPPATKADGFRGIWYMNQPEKTPYKFKYSGGFATYPQQHAPIAIYAPAAKRTFFVYGGKTGEANRISNLIAYYDHAAGTVSRPVALISRATNDTHYNPTLSMDDAGHLYVFANSHGVGYELSKEDPTRGKSYVFRSTKPYAIDGWEVIREDNFSYSQPWLVPGKGILWLHTRYDQNHRRLFFTTTSADGRQVAEPKPLARMRSGSYQISFADPKTGRVATALDLHPDKGGLNARTNFYYIETRDYGQTWTTAGGKPVELPLVDQANGALVRNFEKEGLMCYLKDLTFDADGRPVVLLLTSTSYKPGPDFGPRTLQTARWTGSEWTFNKVVDVDHNYDHGSLYVGGDGTWRILAPTLPGPQAFSTGGQVALLVSGDQGRTWKQTGTLAVQNDRNATYVRRPLNASDDFWAIWADGDVLAQSESDLYFCTSDLTTFRLPRQMKGEAEKPERVR